VIVISNTSPLNYLIQLGKDQVLAALFGTVSIPPAVGLELSRAQAPDVVRAWIAHPPPWLRICAPRTVDPSLDLDLGESQAIALAEELHADRILLDETKARKIAVARGLKVAGTLAILFEAHERGLLDFARTIDELRATTFYLDERLIRTILSRLPKR
jgi:predicted nucleic acid-binding protein